MVKQYGLYLGFIAADGVIQKENQCVSISQKESYILEDIKRTKTNQPLYQKKKQAYIC